MKARTMMALTTPLVLLLCLAGSAFAQSSTGGYGPGSDQPGGERYGPRGGARRMMLPTAHQIEGPVAPDTIGPLLKLSPEELLRYTRRFDNHMASTKPTRDSLRTSVESIRAAFEMGDRSAAGEQRQTVERQWEDLSDRDTEFDRGLKDVFTKDQLKQFKKWKEAREKADREQQHRSREMGGRSREPGAGS